MAHKNKKLLPWFFFVSLLCIFCYTLVQVDRIAFKKNASFNIRHIHPHLEADARWEIPPPTQEEYTLLDEILKQPFRYLAKGNHTFAFVSEDNRYVIKFHKYPSHMRILPWVNRPFAYRFSDKRIRIKEYNHKKLDYNLKSYKDSFCDLKEECGLIYVHINKIVNHHEYHCH
ncbi:MAG: hypothetical protein HYZ48_02760 [Chlamydiales bacterium]|nr:hypothetical protein [Chlamydiales bacterium]